MPASRRWLVAIYILVVLIWGTTWMAIKVSVADIPPFLSAALRFFIASFVLYGLARVRKQQIRWTQQAIKLYLMIGLGNYFIGYGFTYWGVVYIYSSVTAILWATMPLIVSLVAHWMIPEERLSLSRVMGIMVSIAGTFFIIQGQWQALDANALKGVLLVLISILGAAVSNVYYKKHVENNSAIILNMMGMFIGGLALLAGSAGSEIWVDNHFTPSAILAILYLALFGSAIAFTLYFWMFRHFSVVTLSYTTFFIPIVAAVVGWIILGEELTGRTIFGGTLILIGVAIADYRIIWKRKLQEPHVPTPIV